MPLKLVDGEQVIVRTRAHWRALIPAAANLLVTVAVMMFLLGYITRPTQPAFIVHYSHIGVFAVWAIGLLVVAFGTVKPALAWLNRITYLTSHRVVQKNMIGAAQAVVVPLGLLTQVDWRQSRAQGVVEAGDIILIHGIGNQYQRTTLRDMPDAARFHTLIAQELAEYRRRANAHYWAQMNSPAHPGPAHGYGDVPHASFGGAYG
ncbi:hypothetical protein [Nesterenkonia alba]|uniref:hypothetical protein n=1 Tax=Nesterenkonia alba TaxID=515814 RepID=UPI0003B7B893|nr:hypothetical protein [Nesterenkonia alba]